MVHIESINKTGPTIGPWVTPYFNGRASEMVSWMCTLTVAHKVAKEPFETFGGHTQGL